MMVAGMLAMMSLTLVPSWSDPINQMFDTDDMRDPVTLAALLGSVIIFLPAALLAQRWCAPDGARLLSSVTGRLRWNLLARCSGWALLLAMPVIAIAVWQGKSDFAFDSRALLLIGIVLALVPFQAAAEEYAFRGLPMQLLGAWARPAAVAILVPIPFFVAGHMYGLLGSIDVGLFALLAGWLTWRTGGLEAAIGLHVVNNIVIMTLGAVGLADLNATTTSWANLALSIAVGAAYAWLVHARIAVGAERVATVATANR